MSDKEVGIQVRDLSEARRFYREVVGCNEVHASADHVVFSLGGSQFNCQLNLQLGRSGRVSSQYQMRRGRWTLIPHHTISLDVKEWTVFTSRVKRRKQQLFGSKAPSNGLVTRDQRIILHDLSGNMIEFEPSSKVAPHGPGLGILMIWVLGFALIASICFRIYDTGILPTSITAGHSSAVLTSSCGRVWFCT